MCLKKIPFIIIRCCLVLLFLSACCGPIKSFHDVDVMPLYNAEIKTISGVNRVTDVIDTSVFDSYDLVGMGKWTGTGKNPDLDGIDVYFRFESEIQTARDAFLWECDSWWSTTDDFVFGGVEDNQYCISYVNELRDPPDAFCQPTGHYQSFVVFQKGNLLIRILEDSISEDSLAMDDAIKVLAEAVK
jgi:hypothetical protein